MRSEGSSIFMHTLPTSGRPFRTQVPLTSGTGDLMPGLAFMEIKQCQQRTSLWGGSGPSEGAGSRLALSLRGTGRPRANPLGIVIEMDQKLEGI